MKECFLTKRGGDGNGAVKTPLVLFEGFVDSYNLADGFTGFNHYLPDNLDDGGAVNINYQQPISSYCIWINKAHSIAAQAANNKDSAIFCSNEEIDLSEYSMLLIDFFGWCDYGDREERTGVYFMVNKPEILPQSNIAYDWSEWDKIPCYSKKDGKYYYDISSFHNKHFLSIGVYHGTYHINYSNGIWIKKIMLL